MQHATTQHRLSSLQAAEEEITPGPSVSIQGCEHAVIVSQGNGVFHSRGVSTAGCYLGEMLLRGEVLGGWRDGLTDRQTDRSGTLNHCFVEVHPSTAYLHKWCLMGFLKKIQQELEILHPFLHHTC